MCHTLQVSLNLRDLSNVLFGCAVLRERLQCAQAIQNNRDVGIRRMAFSRMYPQEGVPRSFLPIGLAFLRVVHFYCGCLQSLAGSAHCFWLRRVAKLIFTFDFAGVVASTGDVPYCLAPSRASICGYVEPLIIDPFQVRHFTDCSLKAARFLWCSSLLQRWRRPGCYHPYQQSLLCSIRWHSQQF